MLLFFQSLRWFGRLITRKGLQLVNRKSLSFSLRLIDSNFLPSPPLLFNSIHTVCLSGSDVSLDCILEVCSVQMPSLSPPFTQILEQNSLPELSPSCYLLAQSERTPNHCLKLQIRTEHNECSEYDVQKLDEVSDQKRDSIRSGSI